MAQGHVTGTWQSLGSKQGGRAAEHMFLITAVQCLSVDTQQILVE